MKDCFTKDGVEVSKLTELPWHKKGDYRDQGYLITWEPEEGWLVDFECASMGGMYTESFPLNECTSKEENENAK